jgi:putative ABC transport system substrate-binding protein
MRRRQFITFFGAAFTLPTLSPLSVRAQQTARPLVGLIFSGTVAAFADRTSAFRKGLSEMGYVDGDNVTVEYHGLDGDYDHLPPLLDDLIRRRVAVIATPGSDPATLAAKAATATIPVVFGVAEDPVTMGLVTSLAHPGGNATGINFFAHETDAKRLGLMHELVPAASRFAVLMNPINVYGAQLISKDLNEAASALGLTVVFFDASNAEEIDQAFAAIAREKCDALFIVGDGFFAGRQTQFATLTARDRIPASYFSRGLVEAGLLMSYGTSAVDMFRQVGVYTGSILKGTKPVDLPVLQSTKFEFVINLQTARTLGLDIPPMLLARADDVIE